MDTPNLTQLTDAQLTDIILHGMDTIPPDRQQMLELLASFGCEECEQYQNQPDKLYDHDSLMLCADCLVVYCAD